jgi:hypothetical protein
LRTFRNVDERRRASSIVALNIKRWGKQGAKLQLPGIIRSLTVN